MTTVEASPVMVEETVEASVAQNSYVRFQGTVRHPRGHFPGVFALVNGLAREGRLAPEEERFRRTNNDWYNAAYITPTGVYEGNPGAVAWFKASAGHLIDRVDGYLEILAAHNVECRRIQSSDPGRIVYEDPDQVVVVPRRDH